MGFLKKWKIGREQHKCRTLASSWPSIEYTRTLSTRTRKSLKVPSCVSANAPAAIGRSLTFKTVSESTYDGGRTLWAPQIRRSSNKQQQKAGLVGSRSLRAYSGVQKRASERNPQTNTIQILNERPQLITWWTLNSILEVFPEKDVGEPTGEFGRRPIEVVELRERAERRHDYGECLTIDWGPYGEYVTTASTHP